jgi:hypothetical protein
MRREDIIAFVKGQVEPLPACAPCGERYRVSATLTDGTLLPCVIIERASYTVDLAIKRFEDSRNSDDPYMGYRALVRSFVTQANTVNEYDLRDLSLSRFAIPRARAQEMGGETSMSWTEFYATMRDGQEFRFGTSFLIEFFDMPDGYAAEDIIKIVPAVRGRSPGLTGFTGRGRSLPAL